MKIKGCPSEPYFGEKQGLGRLHWAGPGRPRGVRREEVDRGYLRVPRDPTRLSPAGSLSALVSQHSISPLSLPCCLRIPSKGGCPVICPPTSPHPLQAKAESLGPGFPPACLPSLGDGRGCSPSPSTATPHWPPFPADPLEEAPEAPAPANMSTAADLLRQGAGTGLSLLSSPWAPRGPLLIHGALKGLEVGGWALADASKP